VLNLGGVLFTDFTTGVFTDHLEPSKMVTVWPDYVEIGALAEVGGRGPATFGPIHMKDVLVALTKVAPKLKTPSFSRPAPIPASGASSDRVTYSSICSRIQQFLAPNDILIVDDITVEPALLALLLPKDAVYLHQFVYGSIGWATPAAFGAAVADPSRRVILVEGDGCHQLTANEIGAMGRYGVNPIILLFNNGIFAVEEVVMGNSNPDNIRIYDKLAPWQYHKIPEAMGCRDWFCPRVETNAEFDSALQKARKHPGASYIEILLGSKVIAPGLTPEVIDRMYQIGPPKT